jgi:nucleoid-associated protein YgaU
MQRDFKIGMALGLILVIVVVAGLSTLPSLSIKARALSPHSAVHREIGIPSLSHSIEPRKETVIGGNPSKQANNEQLKEMKADPPKGEVSLKAERFHIVRAGETLSDISRQYYGSADKWQKILGADHLPIENPSKIRPGMKLIISD